MMVALECPYVGGTGNDDSVNAASSPVMGGTRSTTGQEVSRDLSKYRVAGPYVLGYTTDLMKGFGKKQAEIREFLWDCFPNRRRGHVVVTIYSIEGRETISSFFVEPDDNNEWHIHVDSRRQVIDIRGKKQSEYAEYDAYFLKRVGARSGYTYPQYLPDSRKLSGTEYELEFQDKDHKRLTEF